MSPGLQVRHQVAAASRGGLVRCDVAGVLGFAPPSRWPPGARRGDFLHLELESASALDGHPRRELLSAPSRRAVELFFRNGGERCHLYSVCAESLGDVASRRVEELLAPLLDHLRAQEELSLLLAPDLAYLPHRADRLGRRRFLGEPAWDLLLEHCREMGSRFLLLDAPRGLHGEALLGWVERFAAESPETRSHGALYYPWLRRGLASFPPSGAVAGLYARSEREHEPFGVVWPPANAPLWGATHAELELDWPEAEHLAESGVNGIVSDPVQGLVVWGARTLSRDPRWRQVNSRRVASFIAEQLRRDNEWAVFEHNDVRVWKVIERDVGIRLKEFWRAGLITGEEQGGDYEVKCDAETNPPEQRELGRLNVRLRFRPVGAIERVTIDLRLGEGTAGGGHGG